jgi:hypothetical protein
VLASPINGTSATALDWSVVAMLDATNRVNTINASTVEAAFAAIGEAVWWITVVDDNLRDRYGKAYRRAAVLTVPPPGETMRGLRSVRNRIGHEVDVVEFVEAIGSRRDRGDGRVSAWAWRSVPPPKSRAARDTAAYRAYENAVAGLNIVHTFGVATGFLGLALSMVRDSRS